MAFLMELICFWSSDFLAGRGGRDVGSYAGARTVYIRPVPLLVVVLTESSERCDMLEALVAIEAIDSLELLRRKLPACEG